MQSGKYIVVAGLIVTLFAAAVPAFAQEAADTQAQSLIEGVVQDQSQQAAAGQQEPLPFAAPELYMSAMQAEQVQDFDRAILDYSLFILLNPTSIDGYIGRAYSYQARGNYDQALADMTQALQFTPQSPEHRAGLYTVRAELYMIQEDFDAAMDDLNAAIEASPNVAQAFLDRAQIYIFENQLDDALADYSAAIELEPEFAPAYVSRGAVNGELGNMEEALADFSRAIDLNPNDPAAYLYRGLIHDELDHTAEAITDYSRVIDLNPQITDAYIQRATAYMRQSDPASALADLNQAIGQAPDNGALYLFRGSVNQATDNDTQAAADYLQWMELNQTRSIDEQTLTSGASVVVEMDEGWVHQLPFSGSEGQSVNVRADSFNADPLLVILDTAGQPLIADDDSGGSLNAAIIGYQLPADGLYTLVVGHAGGSAAGSVRVTFGLTGE